MKETENRNSSPDFDSCFSTRFQYLSEHILTLSNIWFAYYIKKVYAIQCLILRAKISVYFRKKSIKIRQYDINKIHYMFFIFFSILPIYSYIKTNKKNLETTQNKTSHKVKGSREIFIISAPFFQKSIQAIII